MIPIEDSAAPIRDEQGRILGVVLVFRDVTRERKAQALVRRTEKLAVGSKAFSHDGARDQQSPGSHHEPDLYRQKCAGPGDWWRKASLVADQELDRLAHLTRHTFGFYRESKVPEPIEIPDLSGIGAEAACDPAEE